MKVRTCGANTHACDLGTRETGALSMSPPGVESSARGASCIVCKWSAHARESFSPSRPSCRWARGARCHGETKRAVHRFSAIKMRSLNDPHQGSLPTVQTVTQHATAAPAGENDASVNPPDNFDSCSKG